MAIKESGEMYLESIYVLCREHGSVRSIDIAEYMNFSKPSVSRGMGILKKQGYITVDKDGYISLTGSGKKIAEKIFERHTVLSSLFKDMGVDDETAVNDACRIEHVISDETFDAVKKFYRLSKEKK